MRTRRKCGATPTCPTFFSCALWVGTAPASFQEDHVGISDARRAPRSSAGRSPELITQTERRDFADAPKNPKRA